MERAWLTKFFAYAQDADDKPRQEVWARLLAAEVAAPQSVGSRTLALFAQMDEWEIEGFATCCAFSFAFESGWRFMLEDELAEKEIMNYQQGNNMTQHCVDLGLLSPEIDGMRCLSSRGMRVRYAAKVYELAKRGKTRPTRCWPIAAIPAPASNWRRRCGRRSSTASPAMC
ncbi:DUF2806 domain-containing protein [Methylogaea oryzae]|uniref:DUF2806 domain-containing protein n=1 Tax=Methylogaea oryzae TaxID=1295382 RepID=UPI00357161CC